MRPLSIPESVAVEALRARISATNTSRVARQIGVSPQAIRDIVKTGKRPGPTVLAALGISRGVHHSEGQTMLFMRGLAFAAGFILGEGCFVLSYRGCVSVQAAQKEIEPLLRLRAFLGGSIGGPNTQGVHTWRLGSARGVGLMMTLYPLVREWSPKRAREIRRCLTAWRSSKYRRAPLYAWADENNRSALHP